MATKTAVAVRKRTPAKPKKLTSADAINLQLNKQKPGYPALAVIEELSSARTAKDKAKAVDKLFSKIRESLLTGNGTLIVERIAEPQIATEAQTNCGTDVSTWGRTQLQKPSDRSAEKQPSIFEMMGSIDSLTIQLRNQASAINSDITGSGVAEMANSPSVPTCGNIGSFLFDLRIRMEEILKINAETRLKLTGN
jgi:hypothetical protein